MTDKNLTKTVDYTVDTVYALLEEVPSREEWDTKRKLRSSANDLLFYVAEAVASDIQSAAKYQWASSKKSAHALLVMYRFAVKQEMLPPNKTLENRLESIISELGLRIKSAQAAAIKEEQKDLDTWRQKYRLWKEMGK